MAKKHDNVNTDGGSYINGDVHVHGGDFVGRDQGKAGRLLPPLDLDGPEAEAARRRYREALRERYNVIETHAFSALAEDEQVGAPRRPSLLGKEGVYVPLSFNAPVFGTSRQEEVAPGIFREKVAWTGERPASLEEVLRIIPTHLAIIGDAGSGKTTILHVITSFLTAENPEQFMPELALSLPKPYPLPVLLPLRLFEYACNSKDKNYSQCPNDILRFVDEWFARWCPAVNLPNGFLAAHIRAGRTWFLLDALDEVADPTHRETVRNAIKELVDQVGDTRLIVTARTATYRNARLDERFAVVSVRDLDDEQRTEMVHNIYRGLALSNANRRADELAQRFTNSASLQNLARTPVMVWTAAVIHALRGELPESRAALYDAYVNILLKHSFKRTRYDAAAVETLVEGDGWPLLDRRHYLTYAAFQTHRMIERQPERQPTSERGSHVVIGENELVDGILAPYFLDNLGYGLHEARSHAREFMTLMVERSGLLYETEEGYTIGDHLTMQEFLAGCYLGEHYAWEDREGYANFVKDNIGSSWWREVFLLAAGFLAERPGFAALQFLQRISEQGKETGDRLSALSLASQGLLQIRSRQRRPTWYAKLAGQFANRLYAQLYTESTDAPIPVRHDAGLVLGRLYGLPGNETGVGDPRFTGPQGLPDFIQIPAGTFWMGSTEEEVAIFSAMLDEDNRDWPKNELPHHEVFLDTYEVAKYPTTNAMYVRFIAAGGYEDERWWEEAIEDGYWKEGKVQNWYDNQWHDTPHYWNDTRWNNPSQPVVGVNWYEAMAYCRWLTATLDDGYVYRLPTEAEWERAARGPTPSGSPASEEERRIYPWGNDWQEGFCNSKEAGLEQTSPVGLFPQGATSEGVHEMVGNVWEWCRDWYAEDAYAESDPRNPTGPDSGSGRVLRGGSWYNDGPPVCRCGFRNWGDPWGWDNDRGFRCVRTLSSVP